MKSCFYLFAKTMMSSSSSSSSVGIRPKFLILHVDINETVIAGDGAKGYSPQQTLRVAASKYVSLASSPTMTYYKQIEKQNQGKTKDEIEAVALNAIENRLSSVIENGLIDATAAETVRKNADRYAKGCESYPVRNQASFLVLRTFLKLLHTIDSNPNIGRCLVVFRTNGPDMADLMEALAQQKVITDVQTQWRGFGDFQYRHPETGRIINNYTKVDKDQAQWLTALCKANRPCFDTEVLYNEGQLPPSATGSAAHLTHPSVQRLMFNDLRRQFMAELAKPSAHKIQFAGLRDVFLVWQRYNRFHGKPFFYDANARGESPEDPIEMFLDDNAYEEEEKGRPGPYIVTVFVPGGGASADDSGKNFVQGAVDVRYPSVIRPDKERAYMEEEYYSQLVLDVLEQQLKQSSRNP